MGYIVVKKVIKNNIFIDEQYNEIRIKYGLDYILLDNIVINIKGITVSDSMNYFKVYTDDEFTINNLQEIDSRISGHNRHLIKILNYDDYMRKHYILIRKNMTSINKMRNIATEVTIKVIKYKQRDALDKNSLIYPIIYIV